MPPKQQRNFNAPRYAIAMHNVTAADTSFDPEDTYATDHPALYSQTCIAIPGAGCAESAMRLAIAVDEMNAIHNSPADELINNAPPLNTRFVTPHGQDAPTLPTFLNRLTHIRSARSERTNLSYFPVYAVLPDGSLVNTNPGRPFTDTGGYAILFAPECNYDLTPQYLATLQPGTAPIAHRLGHFTFAHIGEQRHTLDVPAVIHSDLPFPTTTLTRAQLTGFPVNHAPPENIFWRAVVTPSNQAVFSEAYAAGNACACPFGTICKHERAFRAMNPSAIDIVLYNNLCIDGGYRGQVERANTDIGHTVTFGPDSQVFVRTPEGLCSRHSGLWGAPLITRHGFLACKDWTVQSAAHPSRCVYIAPYFLKITYAGVCRRGPLAFIKETFLRKRVFRHFKIQPGERAFGDVTGAVLANLPNLPEVNSRLATLQTITPADALDRLRRACNESRWSRQVTPEEVSAWLSTVANSKGFMPSVPAIPSDHCLTCLQKAKTYRSECKSCRRQRVSIPPVLVVPDTVVAHIGRVGLFSTLFDPPRASLKPGVTIKYRGKSLDVSDPHKLFDFFLSFPMDTTCRGWNSGPTFCGKTLNCFPRGEHVGAIAFAIRLATERAHIAQPRPFHLMFQAVLPYITALEQEDEELFLSHFSNEKLRIMLQAKFNIADGRDKPLPIKRGLPRCQMKGFAKAEKAFFYQYEKECYQLKRPQKPRFICCPPPEFLFKIGQFTHAQLKWMKRTFTANTHLFYAGCASPTDLNEWLNLTLNEISEPLSLCDDISACDSNHSAYSFDFHKRVRHTQFRNLDPLIEQLFVAEEHIDVRIGSYSVSVDDVNASGVADTSYKNGLLCLLARVFAIAHALYDLNTKSDEVCLSLFCRVISQVFTSAAGDDGITRMTRNIDGVDITDPEPTRRYSEWWSYVGFNVKVAFYPEHRWRLATYLGMRPVYSGFDYQWAPEPARRLTRLFWQIDNPMHHITWGRGCAWQNLQQSRHLPILSHICLWYLDKTVNLAVEGLGPAFEGRPWSPFNDYVTTGYYNSRACEEFCVDYGVTLGDIDFFVSLLSNVHTPFVNFTCPVLRAIMREES